MQQYVIIGGRWYTVYQKKKNSYKPITNTAWVRTRLCKLQKGCNRLAAASDKVLPVACPWSVVLFGYSGFFHH